MALAVTAASCDDLDQYPNVEETSASVYTSAANYKSVLAKCYALFVTKGQAVGDDNDLTENSSDGSYIRNLFNLQESPTDEIFNTWQSGDNTADITYMQWDASDPWVEDTYQRLYYSIGVCNEFIRNCDDDAIASYGDDLKAYRAEARFLRAIHYINVLDLFRQGPMVTDENIVGAYTPEAADAQELFDYIESELTDCVEDMEEYPEYARAPKAAAYALLAKLYLNAETWVGTDRYADCMTACENVFQYGYTLHDNYAELFTSSNNQRTDEIILPFVVDATTTVTWGATTYLVYGQVASSHDFDDEYTGDIWGVEGAWGMFRITGAFFDLFEDSQTGDSYTWGVQCPDTRCLFWTINQSKEPDVSNSEDQSAGYLCGKWSNLLDDGTVPDGSTDNGVCSIDYPMIRLAEVYLTYAEAALRSGDEATALTYVNLVRARAFGDYADSYQLSTVTLDDILDERGRELYWECSRRTDLVRYDYLTTDSYIWDTKGGTQSGTSVASKYNYYPIPANELTANPNLSNAEY